MIRRYGHGWKTDVYSAVPHTSAAEPTTPIIERKTGERHGAPRSRAHPHGNGGSPSTTAVAFSAAAAHSSADQHRSSGLPPARLAGA